MHIDGSSPATVTELLIAWSDGRKDALGELLPLVYHELRRIASGCLRGEAADRALEPTALIHEAYIRLVDQRRVKWRNRAHFYGVAARIMRRIVVDHVRSENANKRGAGWERVPLTEQSVVAIPMDGDLLALDEALVRLSAFDARMAQIVELRYFGGLTIEEAAEALTLSPATVVREWTIARAWLRAELSK
jgi:RNA polymerase sigma-70 factor (ECF subfamily)